MSNQKSRIITYPDILDKSSNHTVIIVNPTPADIEAVGYFCQTSRKEYDIYLYNPESEQEWFEQAGSRADYILTSGEDNLLYYFKSVDNNE